MRYNHQYNQRRGAALVESTVALVVFMMLLTGIVIGGMKVMHTQTVCLQAQEAARWTSVRAINYQRLSERESPSVEEVFKLAVLPYAKGMDSTKITITIEWIDRSTGHAIPWDKSSKAVYSISKSGEYLTNHIRVTVNYHWESGWLFGQSNIQGICERPITN